MTFEGDQAPNLSNDKRIFRQSQLSAQNGIVLCLQKWVHLETAENSCVHFALANAGRHIEASHGLSRAKKMRRRLARIPLSCSENGIGRRALKRSKRWPVN